MPSNLLEYRLRIRNGSTLANPNGTADVLVITSIRNDTNPYIASPPQGDGLQFDPIKGTVRSGSYTVNVIDAITTGTSRVVTSVLTDSSNRQQLLSRRAYVEFRVDGGAWQTLVAGYITGIRLTDALSYQFAIGDSRRIEQTLSLFKEDNRTAFPVRGTLFGGPVTGDPTIGGWNNPFINRGGWRFRVSSVESTVVGLTFVNGYLGSGGRVTNKWNEVALPRTNTSVGPTRIDEAAAKYAINEVIQVTSGSYYRFPNIIYRVSNTSGTFQYDVTALSAFPMLITLTGGRNDIPHIRAEWGTNTLPSVGQEFLISAITSQASDESPVYSIGHPVDVVKTVYTANNVAVDDASFTALKELQGSYYNIVMRNTAPMRMIEFIESITGPFGIGLRVNSDGQIQAFSSRIKTTNLPSVTVTTSMLRDDGSGAFDTEESTVITSVVLESEEYAIYEQNQEDPSGSRPFDGIAVKKSSYTVLNLDVSTFSSREIKYSVPAMILPSLVYSSQAGLYVYSIVGEIFDRYGRGAVGGDLKVMRGTGADNVQVGDEIYVQVDQLPNNGKRIGDDPSVGARIMQVVRRTETPSGPEFRLLDSGTAAQPVQAPTISIAASTVNPSAIAAFTITNAATLNSIALINVAVQYATGTTTPVSDGTVFTRYTNGSIPTGSVNLPPVSAGSRVWVRARSEVNGLRPSAWTAWTSVLLSNTNGPSSLAAANIKKTAVALQWTNTSTIYPVEVYIAPSGSGPIAPQYLVGTIQEGSTTFAYRLLSGPSVIYSAAVRYVLPNGIYSNAATTTFTTNSTEDFAYRPAGIAIVQSAGAQDASSAQGVPVALWPYDPIFSIEIQRAPDNGSDAPNVGAATTIATVPGTTRVFSDTRIPITNAKWWYRARHVLGGYAASDYTCWKGSTPVAINFELERPDALAPVIVPSVTESGTTATVALAVTDAQCRIDVIRFRHRTDGGAWSVWTVDSSAPYTYSQTIPVSGFLDIEYEVLGFDATGAYGTLAGEVVSFDRNATSDMISVVGTFDSTGAMVLAISGDSDTASIKYAVSAVSQPTLATVQAQTAANGRNINTTLAGPYATNATVYVSVLGYTAINGGGTESALFEYRFVRDGGLIYTQCTATMATSTATTITVTVTGTAPSGTPQVMLVQVTGSATLQSGASPGVLVASGSSWTFTRGAALGQPGGAQFRAMLAGAQSDDDFIEVPEQGRDTTYLVTRARVISTSNTNVVVRVAVLDKYSNLPASITYAADGTGAVTPASPQSVTTAQGDTFPAESFGQYVDFTITRPAFEAGTGRVTFTATASNRVADADAVDVPPQDRDTTYLTTRARVIASTETSLTARIAVIDKYSALSSTIAFVQQGTGGVSPASSQVVTASVSDTFSTPEAAGSFADFTITRPASGQPVGQVTFTTTATGRQASTNIVSIPSQNTYGLAFSIAFNANGTAVLSLTGDTSVASLKFAVSTSGFPSTATVQAQSAINSRNYQATLAGPYALGTTVYVAALTYTGLSGTGQESAIFQAQFTRQNTTPTVINRQPGSVACLPVTADTLYDRQLGYYVPAPTSTGSNPNRQGDHFAQVIIPRNVTLRAVRVNCYAIAPPSNGGSGDIITVNFFRVESNGTNSFLGFTVQNIYSGWQTLAVSSLTESTVGRSYFVRIYANWNAYPGSTNPGNPSDLRVGWIEAEYDKPDTDANI